MERSLICVVHVHVDVTRAVSQICKEVQEYKTKCSRLEERFVIRLIVQ